MSHGRRHAPHRIAGGFGRRHRGIVPGVGRVGIVFQRKRGRGQMRIVTVSLQIPSPSSGGANQRPDP